VRRCGRCGTHKPLEEFAWRRKAKGQRREAAVAKRVKYLVAYFRDHPCVDCGERDPVVLAFDHLRDKKFGIGNGFRDRNWQSVLDEMAKCEVVCANCHRSRTAKRGGFARAAVAQR
jgi:hypothetical protein